MKRPREDEEDDELRAKLDEWVKHKRQRNFTVADRLCAELEAQGVRPREYRPARRRGRADKKATLARLYASP